MSAYIPLRKAVSTTGLHPNTLRKYADNGTIPHYRTPRGDRMLDVTRLVRAKPCIAGYVRVSTYKQKQDLERQWLLAIVEKAIEGEQITLIIAYKDRLARFGFDLIEKIIQQSGGDIVILRQLEISPHSELVADLSAIVTVLSARLHGLRSHKNKKVIEDAIKGSED